MGVGLDSWIVTHNASRLPSILRDHPGELALAVAEAD